MENTLTNSIASNMALAKKAQNSTLQAMRKISKTAISKHDRVAEQIRATNERLDKDPDNPDLRLQLKALLHTKEALLAAHQYGEGLNEQLRGPRPKTPPPSHDIRDDRGKFAQKGSQGHFLGAFRRAVAKVFKPDL